MIEDGELAALHQQVRFRLERHRRWVQRVVDILNAVGAFPTLRLYGRDYEWLHDLPPPRWTLNSASDWARFLKSDNATIGDCQEVEVGLRGAWREAQRRHQLPELPEIGEPIRTPSREADVATPPSVGNPAVREVLERHVARVKRAMVLVLADNPNADLISPGACELVANKANVTAKTMTNWFSGSGLTLTQLVRQLLDEASAKAMQERPNRKVN